MSPTWCGRWFGGLCRTLALVGVLACAFAPTARAAAEDTQAAIDKVNYFIEVATSTERAVESWERYASWVDMKTGPTGKERYISYGMYDLYDVASLLAEARKIASMQPAVAKLDESILRYIDAYEALAPIMSKASAYYDSAGYEADKAAAGQAMHVEMVPLATAFLNARDAMMPELRRFLREVEGLELAEREAREGRTAAWQAGQVLHAANRVIDLFPRDRPQQLTGEELDQAMANLGPETSGEEFDAIMMGAKKPPATTIDVAAFSAAVDAYAAAVTAFDGFEGEKPEEFDELKPLPRQLLEALRAFEKPLADSKGQEFDGAGQMAALIVQQYFELFNAGNGIAQSQIRYLP